MSTIEIIIFIVVLFLGVLLFYQARKGGKELRLELESKAKKRLELELKGINLSDYTIYRYNKNITLKNNWVNSTSKEMKEKIKESCSQYVSNGTYLYREAEFSLDINHDSKVLRYIVGENEFEFSEKHT